MESEQKSIGQNQKTNETVPTCCVGCVRWERFGKNCWYYWEGKKHCTMWTSDLEEAAMQQSLF